MNKIKNTKQKGFIQAIIIVVIALLLMRYFNITISGILNYFHISWTDILAWFQKALTWFKDLVNSVK